MSGELSGTSLRARMRIGQRILDLIRLRENIHGIEADDVQNILRVARAHKVVLNIRFDHMLKAVPPIGLDVISFSREGGRRSSPTSASRRSTGLWSGARLSP